MKEQKELNGWIATQFNLKKSFLHFIIAENVLFTTKMDRTGNAKQKIMILFKDQSKNNL